MEDIHHSIGANHRLIAMVSGCCDKTDKMSTTKKEKVFSPGLSAFSFYVTCVTTAWLHSPCGFVVF